MKQSPLLAAILAFTIAFSPTAIFAQDFEFEEEETETEFEEEEPGDGEEPEVDTQDPAGLEFSEEEGAKNTYSDAEEKSVAIVAMAGEEMDSDRRGKVQAEMERVAGEISAVSVVGGGGLLSALEASGGEACVQEPLCLADVGEQAGAERILVARVVKREKGLELKIDYFDVDDKLFVKYENVGGLGGTGAVVSAIEPALKKIFDVREFVDGPDYQGDENKSVVQTVLAYGFAGLAVASLAGGIVMGLGAKSTESDVEGRPKTGDVYSMTQVEAREAIRPAEKKATTANVFYGLAAGFAAVSVLFFLIRGGSDVGEDEKATTRKTIRDINVAPAVTADGGIGFGAGFRF